MNREDLRTVEAVSAVLDVIAQVVEEIVTSFRQGGRLFYVGAGTSGRLGVLDASECPPTFGTDPNLVQAIIAGGDRAVFRAVEEAEDDPQRAKSILVERGFASDDVLVGISASGRTPFVLGAVEYAKELGAVTAGIFCNPGAPLGELVDYPILLEVGPEVLAGSTRLKAGTATKMVLNMLTTAAMVRWGRCKGNLMVDLQPACSKLRDRAVRILSRLGGIGKEEARRRLDEAGGNLRLALDDLERS